LTTSGAAIMTTTSSARGFESIGDNTQPPMEYNDLRSGSTRQSRIDHFTTAVVAKKKQNDAKRERLS
jgi:hypothetical protein